MLPTAAPETERTPGWSSAREKEIRLKVFVARVEERIAQFAAANLVGLPLPVLFVAFVLGANLLLNIANGVAAADDREQLAHTLTWAWGYSGVQPPLHTWIVKLVAELIGPGLNAIYVTRFLVLFLVYVGVFVAARLMRLSAEAAAAAMLGLFLLPQIGWEAQRTFSHSLTGLLGVVLSLASILWIARRPGPLPYAALGAAAAAAILGKYNGAIFLLGLCIGLAATPSLRRPLRPQGLLISLGVFVLLTLGPGLWVLANLDLVDDSAGKFAFGATGSGMLDRLYGLGVFLVAFGGYVGLLYGVAFLALPHRRRLGAMRAAFAQSMTLPVTRLPMFAILTGLVFVVGGLLVSGATNVKIYWLHPILVTTPLVVAASLARIEGGERANRAIVFCAVLAAGVTVLVFVARLAGLR